MAGIYIHIPFCKKACTYCDFHFTTSLKYTDEMVGAICKEIRLKKNRISENIGSIYFGGGTPSVLPISAFTKIFDALTETFTIDTAAEITIEANPDDLTAQKITALKELPVNRFSIGIQSFFEEDLKWMNRAHNAQEAETCIKRSQDAGFENLSIDLIYGYPLLRDEKWAANINKALELQTPHLSAYSLTVEAKTALDHAIKIGKQKAIDEEQSARHFLFLNEQLGAAGFDAYEISNYARPNRYAIHNTNYWRGVSYLGIGPSAHGFDGNNRYLNLANNSVYLNALNQNQLAETIETLSLEDRYNEYIMTSLRTMWGVDLQHIAINFGQHFVDQLLKDVQPALENKNVSITPSAIFLTPAGKLFADGIAASLFSEMG